jgi:hypothetical protein
MNVEQLQGPVANVAEWRRSVQNSEEHSLFVLLSDSMRQSKGVAANGVCSHLRISSVTELVKGTATVAALTGHGKGISMTHIHT